jgi:hypothetical protein
MGIFAEALAAAMNPSCAGGNHAAVYVEREVINWFKQIVGFPPESMGLLVSGGSMAALTGLAVARQVQCGYDLRTQGLQGSTPRLKFCRTGEGHGCHQKAIELLGIGSEHLRSVEHDHSLRMIPSALDAAIREDRQRGDIPIAVIANAGTVNRGAIDPLDEIADVCAQHKVWLHVDGAYGAPAILTGRYAKQLSALARADSIALDPHKWLYVPVEAGVVLVRDARHMRATFSLVPPYLQTDGKTEGVGGLPWFSEYGFQQTRGFRALKVWMALRYHGLSGYRSSIERDIRMAGLLVTFRNFEKNVYIRCRNVAHQIAEREFVWAESPIDLTGWNSPDDIHRALMDFSEIPEKLLRVTNFHVYPPFFEKREERTGHGGDQPLFAVRHSALPNLRLPFLFQRERKTAGVQRSDRMLNRGRQDVGSRQSFGQSPLLPWHLRSDRPAFSPG